MLRKSRIVLGFLLISTALLALLGLRHQIKPLEVDPRFRTQSIDSACHNFFNAFLNRNKRDKSEITFAERIQAARQFGNCFSENGGLMPLPEKKLRRIMRKLFPMFNSEADLVSMHQKSERGIVIPVEEDTLEQSLRLINVFKRLKVELPIQLMHLGTLSPRHLSAIGTLAPSLRVFATDLRQYIDEGNEDMADWSMLPWLSLIFSEFSDIIYTEPSVIPLVNVTKFFDSKEYLDSGVLFFRDRVIPNEFYTAYEQKIYNKLMPSRDELISFRMSLKNSDRGIFNDSILKNQMANGMFAIKKSNHLTGLLTGVLLQLNEETSEPSWGSKELMWIAQHIAGNRDLRFNPMNAAAIGKVETYDNDVHKIYSSHTVQFTNDMEPLWISGGFQNCQHQFTKDDWEAHPALREQFDTVESLDRHYKSMLDIDGAIIPESETVNTWKAAVLAWRGWAHAPERGCNNYIWRAEDSPEHAGIFKKFSDKELNLIDDLRVAWSAPLNLDL